MKASDNVFPKLLFAEGAAPAAPAAGSVIAYAKADGLLYSKDDAGTETPLGGGGGSGDVSGPASSVDSHVALFDGTTGKLLKDGGALGGMAGINDAPSDGVTYGRKDAVWVPTAGSGDFSGPASSVDGNIVVFDGTSGKLGKDGGAPASRAPNIQSVTSASTVTPTFSNDMVRITAQAAALTLANPTGTAIPGLGLVVRIKDDGTQRAISYGSQYRAIGVTLPTTTVAGKTLYLAMIYNDTDTKWDVVAVGQQA